mgnify:FL=1
MKNIRDIFPSRKSRVHKLLFGLFGVTALTAMAFVIWIALDEMARIALFDPVGTVTDGKLLGVPIGASPAQAQKTLSNRGFKLLWTGARNDCPLGTVRDGHSVDYYLLNSWQQGALCIIYKNDSINQIYWGFWVFYI